MSNPDDDLAPRIHMNSEFAHEPERQLTIWMHAVQIESSRILGDGVMGYTGPLTRKIDACLFVVALRNVLRAAEMVRTEIRRPLKREATTAINEVTDVMPDAVKVRDVLMHFDKYAVGRGDIEREANSSAPFESVHEMDRAAHVLRIRVAPGVELTVDVKSATVAATRLNARLSDLLARQRASEAFERTIAIARHQAGDHSEQTTL